MTYSLKKPIALLLSLAMLAGMATFFSTGVSAVSDDTLTVNVSSSIADLFPDFSMQVDESASQVTVSYYINTPGYRIMNCDWTLEYDSSKLAPDLSEGGPNTKDNADGENVLYFMRYATPKKLSNAVYNTAPRTYEERTDSIRAITGNVTNSKGYNTGSYEKRVFVAVTFNVLENSGAADVKLMLKTLQVCPKDSKDSQVVSDTFYLVKQGALVETEGNVFFTDSDYSKAESGATVFADSALDTSYELFNLVIEQSLALNFFYPAERLTAFSNVYMETSGGGRNTRISPTNQNYSGVTYKVFQFRDIYPQLVTTPYNFRIVGVDPGGNRHYGPSVVECVKDYILASIGSTAINDKYKTLFMALLDYAEKAQYVKNYNLGNLALSGMEAYNDYLPQETQDVAVDVKYEDTGANEVKWQFGSLVLKDIPTFRMYFSLPQGKQMTDYYVMAGRQGAAQTKVQLDPDNHDSYGCFVEYDKIYAQHMRTDFKFTVYDAQTNQPASKTILYSVEDYAASFKDSYSALTDPPVSYTKLYNLLLALIRYGDAAAAAVAG